MAGKFMQALRKTLLIKTCFLSLCSLFTNSTVAADNFSNSSPNANFIIIFLLTFCFLLIAVIIKLNKRKKELGLIEAQLTNKHTELEKLYLERSENLVNLNSQLYDEIAKHERTEKLLRETQGYIQNIINSMPSILIGVTREGIITHWNSAAQKATGISYDKALGHSLDTISPDLSIHKELITRAITLQKTQKRENQQRGHGSQAEYTDLTVYPLISSNVEGAVIRIDDVTLRVRLETMMIQNEKMNSLGELAAGVAHEINNPLGTILQSIQNIKRRISNELEMNKATAYELGLALEDINVYLKNREILTFLDDIKEAGERATVIVKNMLEFSRADNKQYDAIDIRELLDRSIELAIHSIGAANKKNSLTILVNKAFPEKCPPVKCFSAELQQVILNLLNNAYHAFSEAKQNNPDFSNQQLEIKIDLSFSDASVRINIADNGPGMNTWTQRHIFDPFFTTKEVGKGTGLGLSVSYFIITEHHGGMISVNSKEGCGTTFTIEIPLNLC